jgi:hypothetical protein
MSKRDLVSMMAASLMSGDRNTWGDAGIEECVTLAIKVARNVDDTFDDFSDDAGAFIHQTLESHEVEN